MAVKTKQKQGAGRPSRLQCACALAGFLVTLATALILARAALSDPPPATLTIAAESFRPTGGGWVVDVVIVNHGGRAASSVDVEGQVGEQLAGATLDYVPGGGKKKASLVFTTPTRPDPALRVLGWSEP